MTISGNVSTQTITDNRAHSGGDHGVVLQSVLLAGDGETWPAGLILARDSDGKHVPYEAVTAEALGAGDGESTTFAFVLANAPVEPGSVSVTVSNASLVDDGFGRLWSDDGSGSVNYETGAITLTMLVAPGNLEDIAAAYALALACVLDEERITTADTDAQALVVVHGGVARRKLKVGVSAQSAPNTALLASLAKHGIYAA